MQSKYLKTALILIFCSIFIITAIFVTVLISINKDAFLKPSPQVTTCKQDQAVSIATRFIENTPTYTFDGVEGSIQQIEVVPLESGKAWGLSYIFKCKHTGYGDRSNQVLEEQVTGHSVQITIEGCTIVNAVCDKTYDLLTNQQLQ